MTNVLLLSAGTRNKVIQYFRRTFQGRGNVIATDMSALAPAIYEADRHYIVPHITDPNYLDIVLDICAKERIAGVLSLIDPELSLLAANEKRFAEIGARVIGSSYELCERALDKMQMYRWLVDHNYPGARSYASKAEFFRAVNAEEVRYPVFVKPVRGSASIAVNKVYDRETVELLFARDDSLMVQEFLDGQEMGVDCYIDMISGELVSVFAKKKLLMRAGETDKSVSFKDDALFALVARFVAESGWRGQIDIDVFGVNNTYCISEVNPRFGGGYPHAHECGCNHMELIMNNLNGKINRPTIGDYKSNIFMMKYSEIMIKGG